MLIIKMLCPLVTMTGTHLIPYLPNSDKASQRTHKGAGKGYNYVNFKRHGGSHHFDRWQKLYNFCRREYIRTVDRQGAYNAADCSNEKAFDQKGKLCKDLRCAEQFQCFDFLAFSMEKDLWSRVFAPAHGDLHFFQVRDRVFDEGSVLEKVDAGQKILSNDARRFLMEDVLEVIKSKGAISLEVPGERDSEDLEAEVK